jgi:hypothetical protein
MSKARQLFWEATSKNFPAGPNNQEAIEAFKSAPSYWRESNNYFSAGFAISKAVMASWGSDYDDKDLEGLITLELQDFGSCVETSPTFSYESLSALSIWIKELRKIIPLNIVDSISVKRALTDLGTELAQRLINHKENSIHLENYLVRGYYLSTDLEGNWEASFPSDDSHWAEELWGNGMVVFTIPSAFSLFLAAADYQGANAVIERCPEAFTTPELKGWKAAVQGFVNPHQASERFIEAANAFAEDTQPAAKERRYWSSANIDVWSKYFRAKADLAMAVREPHSLKEHLIAAASNFSGPEPVWYVGSVVRFRILVQTLAMLISDDSTLEHEQARQQFLTAVMIAGEDPDDLMMLHFLELSFAAIEGFKTDPAQELASGRLGVALEALSRIPIIGSDVAAIAAPVIRNRALEDILGPHRTWVHRTLESIRDENRHLQKIILRLAQASIPLYAQIRQGPLEYGKDVVVFFERDGQQVLIMYQVKCGDITIPKWRESRSELEEAFLVPLSNFQIPEEPDARQAILICNGHALPHVEPVMKGWFEDQRRAYGRDIQFMHLDSLVKWIMDERLINEFKAVLAELKLKPIF